MRQSLPHGLPEGAPQTDSDKQELCRAQAPRPENPAYGRYHYLPHFPPGLHFRPHGGNHTGTQRRADRGGDPGKPYQIRGQNRPPQPGHEPDGPAFPGLRPLPGHHSWPGQLQPRQRRGNLPGYCGRPPHRRPAARPLRTAGPHRRLYPTPHPPSFAGSGAGFLPG